MKSLFVLGAGGHAKVLIDALLRSGVSITGCLDINKELHGKEILSIPILGGEEILKDHSPKDTLLVNGIGSTANNSKR